MRQVLDHETAIQQLLADSGRDRERGETAHLARGAGQHRLQMTHALAHLGERRVVAEDKATLADDVGDHDRGAEPDPEQSPRHARDEPERGPRPAGRGPQRHDCAREPELERNRRPVGGAAHAGQSVRCGAGQTAITERRRP